MANHLINCTSPYLQQHIDNPVDWYPWAPEALDKAKEENKPIFLSIGYSACHWCHVMAHESFEDHEIAEILNKHFINIKIDREERPDLDKIFQLSHQILTGQNGGWPLSIFLSPKNLLPFFSGTYFPKEQRFNLPGFKQLLLKIQDFYENHYSEILNQDQQLESALEKINQGKKNETQQLTVDLINNALITLEKIFDPSNGGFYKEPKFPHPAHLQFLLQYYSDNPHEKIKNLLLLTLDKMSVGGIHDLVGGGFFRYSVDQYWMIPHFEKMLYDNAQLISIYASAAKIFNKIEYQEIAFETIEWAKRELLSPNGAFYSTLDADSEGEEGRFYLWNQSDILTLLTPQEYQIFEKTYRLNEIPNIDHHWHLHAFDAIAPKDQILLKQGLQKLFKEREKRKKPHRDEKILTGWNALMIQALALTGQLFNRNDFIELAKNNLNFIQNHLYKNKQLYASIKDQQLGNLAYLDDHVFLIIALLQLLQIEFDENYWQFMLELTDTLCEKFYDHEHQGFYFTSSDQTQLFHRPKTFLDEAIPAGNGLASQVLLKLGYLTGNITYIDLAEKTLVATSHMLKNFPDAGLSSMTAAYDFLFPAKRIILSGEKAQIKPWLEKYFSNYHPRQVIFPLTTNHQLPDSLKSYAAKKNEVNAYICQGMQCSAQIHDINEFK